MDTQERPQGTVGGVSTRWLQALGKGKVAPEVLPPAIRPLGQRALQEAGSDWDCSAAGAIIAAELASFCKKYLLGSLGKDTLAQSDYRDARDALLLLVRFFQPVARGSVPLSWKETAEELQQEDTLAKLLPGSIEEVRRRVKEQVVVSKRYRELQEGLKRAVQRLEILAAKHCASLPEESGQAQEPPSVAEPGPAPLLSASARRPVMPRWPALPDPYVERREVLQELVQKIEMASSLGGWVAVQGGIQVGKTVLLAGLRKWIEQGGVPGAPWEGIAFVTADVPADATPGEVEQGRLRLIGDLAGQLGVSLPDIAQTSLERASALKEGLGTRRVLILVDDVESAQILVPLKDPPHRAACVLATRSMLVADEMARSDHQIHLRGMSWSEALELIQAITGNAPFPVLEEAGVEDLYEAVGGHPVALVILAMAALRTNNWYTVHSAFPEGICAEEALCTKEGMLRWKEVVGREWSRMGKDMRRRLAALGRLPLLSTYDTRIGQALWGGDEEEVEWAFLKMVEHGLLEPVVLGRLPPGRLSYRMLRNLRSSVRYLVPWLVWLFVQEQRQELTLLDKVRCAVAAWHYPVNGGGLPGITLLVPMIPPSFWDLVCSTWTDKYNAGLVPVWLGQKYTYHRFPLTTPREWAVIMRMRWVYLSIWGLALVAVVLGKLLNFPCAGVLALFVAALTLMLAMDNQRRLNLWRKCKKSFVERL